jgi:hypothetical protein
MISAGMPLRAADRMTVAKPTEAQVPTAMRAQLTMFGSPRNEMGPRWATPRPALIRPMFGSGA